MIIRASDNTRFSLFDYEMIERTKWKPFYLYRSELRRALKDKSRSVDYYLMGALVPGPSRGLIVQGVTQRNKKFISIGCKRFVGESRKQLIRWAKSGNKGEK